MSWELKGSLKENVDLSQAVWSLGLHKQEEIKH